VTPRKKSAAAGSAAEKGDSEGSTRQVDFSTTSTDERGVSTGSTHEVGPPGEVDVHE